MAPKVSNNDNNTPIHVLPQLNRIFLIMHHKEIALKVDTAKLILAAFPDKCRLVVAGIGPEYQESMKELQEAMQPEHGESNSNNSNKNCLVLFPDDNAHSMEEILLQDGQHPSQDKTSDSGDTTIKGLATIDPSNNHPAQDYQPYDLIVLDGTWAQARKIHSKYIPPIERGGPRRVQLSESAVATLQEANDQSGHQLRRHSTAWRQVGTYEATRLFLKDLETALPASSLVDTLDEEPPVWEQIAGYQAISNEAARRELGPARVSQKKPQ